jgi:hypothetical protein
LLCRLSDRFFGSDSVPDYPDGYLLDPVIREVERFLRDRGWDDEDGQPLATPLNIQAAGLVGRLSEAGWLVKEKLGLRTFVSMRPVVMRFFQTLRQFAEEGPQHIGGSIQLIYNQLQSVQKDPRGQAAGFASAARLCSQLINSLSATTLRARDLMRSLKDEESTSAFVRRFFTEHIEELYIRDFKSLRTENHPLSLRIDILSIVSQLSSDECMNQALLGGYAAIEGNKPDSMERAAAEMERDFERFRRLSDVELFLDRMDRVMESATQRALAFITYRLKANDRIEAIIDDVGASVLRTESLRLPIEGRLVPPEPVVSEARMQAPSPPPAKPVRKAMKKPELTLEQRARLELRRAMISNRDMSPAAVQRFVEASLQPGQSLTAAELPALHVCDAVAYLGLMRMAAQFRFNRQAFTGNPLMRRLGFSVVPREDPANGDVIRVTTVLFDTTDFIVTRSKTDAS